MHRVGFEPTRKLIQQILSLPPWTTRASVHTNVVYSTLMKNNEKEKNQFFF